MEGMESPEESVLSSIPQSPAGTPSPKSSTIGTRDGSASRNRRLHVAWVPLDSTSPPPGSPLGSPPQQEPVESFEPEFVTSVAIPEHSTPPSSNGSPSSRVGGLPHRLPQLTQVSAVGSSSSVHGGDWSVSSLADMPRLAQTTLDESSTPPQGSLHLPKRLQLLGTALSPLPVRNPLSSVVPETGHPLIADIYASPGGSSNERPPELLRGASPGPPPDRDSRRTAFPATSFLVVFGALCTSAVLLTLCLVALNAPALAQPWHTASVLDGSACGGASAPSSYSFGVDTVGVLRPALDDVYLAVEATMDSLLAAVGLCPTEGCAADALRLASEALAVAVSSSTTQMQLSWCRNESLTCVRAGGNLSLSELLVASVPCEMRSAIVCTAQESASTCYLHWSFLADGSCSNAGRFLVPWSLIAFVPVYPVIRAAEAGLVGENASHATLAWVPVAETSPALLRLHFPVDPAAESSATAPYVWNFGTAANATLVVIVTADMAPESTPSAIEISVWASTLPLTADQFEAYDAPTRAILTFFLVLASLTYATTLAVLIRHHQAHAALALRNVTVFSAAALDWRTDAEIFHTRSADLHRPGAVPWIALLQPTEVYLLSEKLEGARAKLLEYRTYLPSSMFIASNDAEFLISDDADANVSDFAPLFRLYPEVEEDHPQTSLRGGAGSSASLNKMGTSRGPNSPNGSVATPPGSPSSRQRRAEELPLDTTVGQDALAAGTFRAFRSPTSPQLEPDGAGASFNGEGFGNSVAGSFTLPASPSPTARAARRLHAGAAASRGLSVVSLSPARMPADVTTFTLGKKRITCLVARLYFSTPVQNLPSRVVQIIADAFYDVASHSARQFDGVLHKVEVTGVAVMWNAFAPYPFHELRGSLCAQFIAAQLHRLEDELPVFRRCGVRYSVAVNTGGAVVGSCGTARHSAFCVVSDSWTFAEKVCDLAHTLDCGVLLLEATHAIARNQLFCMPIDIVGSDQMRVTLFELRGDSGSRVFGQFKTYVEGFSLFAQCKFAQAAKLLAACDGNPHAARLLRFCELYAAENDSVARYWRSAPFWTVHELDAQDLATADYVARTLGGSEQLALSESFSMQSPNSKALPQPGSAKFGVHALPRASVDRPQQFQVLIPPALALPAYGVRRRVRHHSLRPELALRTELESRASDDHQRQSKSWSVLGTPNVVSPGVFADEPRTAFPSDEPDAEVAALTQEPGITDTAGCHWTVSDKVLGEGAFGTVRLGLSDSGQLVALKYLALPHDLLESGNRGVSASTRLIDGSRFKGQVEATLSEVALLAKLHHDNIVSYLGSALVDDALVVIMEYVSGGTLGRMLTTFGWLPLAGIRLYARDVLQGLRYLHGKSIIHRDISPHNVLVTPEGRCKLTDFGASVALQKLAGGQRRVFGTPAYMAPEACRGESTTASDVWSVGILLCQLFSGEVPYAEADRANIEEFVKNLGQDDTMMPQVPSRRIVDEAALDMIRSCLQRDPQLRPTADQLLLNPFFI